MSRRKLTWDELSPSTKDYYAKRGDPRVPADYPFVKRPVGRPKGTPQSLETRQKLSGMRFKDDAARARRVAKAIAVLMLAYGSVDAIIRELRRGN
jgi:hypothetical protein